MQTLILPPPVPYPDRYLIDPVAFCLALVGGPLMFTGLTFWTLIPVFAVVIGGPVYLAFGTPVLLWHLRRNDGDPTDLALLAFKVMALLFVIFAATAVITGNNNMLDGGLVLAAFGLIFAPAWAYFFGNIYRRLRSDFFARPRPFQLLPPSPERNLTCLYLPLSTSLWALGRWPLSP